MYHDNYSQNSRAVQVTFTLLRLSKVITIKKDVSPAKVREDN